MNQVGGRIEFLTEFKGRQAYVFFHEEKDADRTLPNLWVSSQDRSDRSVGRIEIVKAISGPQSACRF